MKTYFYYLLHKYLSLYIRPGNSLVDIHPQTDHLLGLFREVRTAVVLKNKQQNYPTGEVLANLQCIIAWKPDYLLLNGNIHYERDIQQFLEALRRVCDLDNRIIITYYNSAYALQNFYPICMPFTGCIP